MKKENLPSPEAINRAKDLAFFADELLSEEILKSEEKLQAYIKRHRGPDLTAISDEELITAADKANLFSESIEVLRQRSSRCGSWIIFKVCFLPAFLFSVLAWYFLATPIEDWPWDLGSYNQVILEVFPRAQTWVNISIEYREKMIFLFACFTVLLVFGFLYLFLLILKDWQALMVEFVPPKKHKCKGREALMLAGVIMGLIFMLYFSLGSYLKGSEIFLTSVAYDVESYKYSIYSEYRTWNTIFGFILFFSLSMFFSVLFCSGLFDIISSARYCHKLNEFKFKIIKNKSRKIN